VRGSVRSTWQRYATPKGTLGILDIKKIVRALCLRWLWLEWVAPDKPWVRLEPPNDDIDRKMFNTTKRVSISDVKREKFWSSS
jgi:hypothetical protein